MRPNRPMNLAGLAWVATFSLVAVASAGAQFPEIDRTRVERVIRVLAADDMEGRAAFTPAAMRAAEFIAGELDAAGVATIDGADDHLQRFPVYSISTESCAVTIEARQVSPVACLLGTDSVTWSGADVEVTRIEADDNPMEAFGAARRGGVDALLLFHVDHRRFFDQMARGFSRPARSIERGGGTSLIAAVTEDLDAAPIAVRATARVEELPLANVVGTIPGNRADEFVVFSAHYDHIGTRQPVDGDAIGNGANDNASGTTAVIELARYFAARGTPERTLVFVAFTAEEAGGMGSRYFSEQLDPDRIVAMFNIEMIGKPAVSGPNTAWITGFDRSSFGEILQAAVEGTEYEFYADPYPDQNLFYRSDNATLARLGVPAHTISTTPIDVDPDYHRVTDHVETLDLDHMTNTIRAIAAAAATIVSGEATPTRVNTEELRR